MAPLQAGSHLGIFMKLPQIPCGAYFHIYIVHLWVPMKQVHPGKEGISMNKQEDLSCCLPVHPTSLCPAISEKREGRGEMVERSELHAHIKPSLNGAWAFSVSSGTHPSILLDVLSH